jgi:hypothetical protein
MPGFALSAGVEGRGPRDVPNKNFARGGGLNGVCLPGCTLTSFS